MDMPAGRPPKFNTPEQLQVKVDEYFDGGGCAVKEVIIGSGKSASVIFKKMPTITGLALFLGFKNRKALYDYEKVSVEFAVVIQTARSKVERAYEENLSNPYCSGSIFALKNMGWRDDQGVAHSGTITFAQALANAAGKKTEVELKDDTDNRPADD